MPFVREFAWGEDEMYGNYGWMLKGAPGFNAGLGLAVAHDTLEHFPGRYHTLEDEMLAFGSIMYMRVEGGWFYRRGSFRTPAENLVADVYRFLVEDHNFEIKPRKTRKLDEECEAEYQIRDMEVEFRKLWESEGYYGEPHTLPLSDGLEAFHHCMDWLRTGYRMAVKRWGKFPEQWAYLFTQIEEEVDKRYSHADYGETLRVSVDIANAEYTIRRVYEDDY